MPAVEVRLLGGFAVTAGDEVAEGTWRLRKARELVKLLALAPGHRLHREQMMDVLWRDRDPVAALNNLHQAVHVARRALGADAIEVRDQVLLLVAEVDVDRFEQAAADARQLRTRGAYRAALSIYGGELLPENRYDDWAAARRDELAQLQAALAAELGELTPGRFGALPADVSSFVGRGRELAELQALLGGTRLLTLSGVGGVGKTRLALELARGLESSFADGAVLVELADVADRRFVPDAVAAALDVRALAGESLVDALADFLRSRTLLLVLDNCEHVLGSVAGLITTLLREAPRLRAVATSREPLRIAGEVVFRVPSLAIPDPDSRASPAESLAYEAVQLFAERGSAAMPGFSVDAHNAADVARICFRLDGLPLAIELAAGRLGALDPAALAERLDSRFGVLRATSGAAPTRQQTLSATLDWSHGLLDADERVLFRRLSVFAGGFQLAAAELVCGDDRLPGETVVPLLARLVDKSLVAVDVHRRERRYRLLETVRVYATDRLAGAGESAALVERHARWALALAEGAGDAPGLDRDAANLRAGLDWVVAHEPNLAVAFCLALWPFWLRRTDLAEAHQRFLDALAAGGGSAALRADALLAAAAIDVRAGSMACGLGHARESLQIAVDRGDGRAEWRAVHFLGGSVIAHDEPATALVWFARGLQIADREGWPAARALGVYSMGLAQALLGEAAAAEELVARSVEEFRALSDSSERVPAPTNLGETFSTAASDRAAVRIVFEDTLQPFVEISCKTAVGYLLANQAQILRVVGDLARARALLAESRSCFESTGDERGCADVAVRQAYVEIAEGELPAARDCLEQALEQRRGLNDRRRVGLALQGLGLVETIAGDHVRAAARLAEAEELFRRSGDRWGLATTLWRIADLALARGDLDGAEAALHRARRILDEAQRERWIALTLAGLAELALLRGDPDQADALLLEAGERFRAKHDELGAAAVEDRRQDLLRRR